MGTLRTPFSVATGAAATVLLNLPTSGSMQTLSLNVGSGSGPVAVAAFVDDIGTGGGSQVLHGWARDDGTEGTEVTWTGSLTLKPNLRIKGTVRNDTGSTVTGFLQAWVV